MKRAGALLCALVLGTTAATGTAGPVSAATADADGPSAAGPVVAVAPGHAPATTPLGFFWQLTAPQLVEPGALLVASPAPATTVAARKKRTTTHSDQQFFQISATGSNDVPEAALRAYRRAADAMASCGISWQFLAAIGRVESDHGRYGAAQLGSDGVSRPAIVGPRLDGAGPFAAIPDSDRGTLDGDKVWDRAVGQMQFLPGTWRSVARDGDGDGTRDPQDIDDSALGSAVYLCGAGNLSTVAGMSAAAFRYNRSDYYVALVLSTYNGYRTGVFSVPSPPPPPATPKPRAERPDREPRKAGATAPRPPRPSATPTRPSAPRPPAPGTPAPAPTPSGTPTPPPPPSPERSTLRGVLGGDGDTFRLEGVTLDLSGWAGEDAGRDWDGDGATETNRQELTGLREAGSVVQLVVDRLGDTAQVVRLEPTG